MLKNQRNVGFSEVLEKLYADDDSDYKVNDSDRRLGPDSDGNEEKSKIVAEGVDSCMIY